MSSIWFHPYTIADINEFSHNNMIHHIGITFTELGDDYLKGTMPVDERTVQTMGMLHGGASVTLAETLGSIGANLVVDPQKFVCVGLDINANHIRSIRNGFVAGIAKPIHTGGTTQVWNIEITDKNNRLICTSRLTMAVLSIQPNNNNKNPFNTFYRKYQ
ncbi:MAG TPA: hotdog fold thioesterase [Chitinophagaceae bacterium]|nr:hotdog fold thioesterase [Chitinophagaceae bacterium]